METSWTLIESAAGGGETARDDFARRYRPVVEAYLGARWRHTPHAGRIEDATQDVFVDCLRDGGVLERADRARSGGFRAFLFGVVRRVAQNHEVRSARQNARRADGSFHPEEHADDETSLSNVFDRAWARAVVAEAGELHRARARAAGPAAERRVELLRLRFEEGRPIRDIARSWNADPARTHHDYARARNEFRDALRDVVALHQGCHGEALDRECAQVLSLLRGEG